jgi:hypothetical protein
MMEDHNEWGNCWEDLVRRIDMENQHADKLMREWSEADVADDKREEDQRLDGNMRQAGLGKQEEKKVEGKRSSRKVKECTGEEKQRWVVEAKQKRSVTRAKDEAKRMVKKRKMKTIDSYFKNVDS